MKVKRMFLIFILTLASVVCNIKTIETRCCLPEQGNLVKNGTSIMCINSVTNEKSNVRLKCNTTESPILLSEKFEKYPNGSITLFIDNDTIFMESDIFCHGVSSNNETVLALCPEPIETRAVSSDVLGYCLLVSVVFLVFTAIIYCAIAELRDTQGKSIINFCVSLAIGLAILGITNIGFEYSDMTFCSIRGFLLYIFILGGFFWTNAISVQMLIAIRRPSMPDYSWRTFIWYALYAWGTPALLTICMAIVNFYPGKHEKPGIGLSTCWFYNQRLQWYYMYSIITIIIIANICIFLYISVHLWRRTNRSTLTKELRYKFLMTSRLVIIMGLPWIFEIISTFFEDNIIWVVFDIFNTLQGPLIFLVLVVFRPRALKGLYRLGVLNCMSGIVEKHLAVIDDAEEPMQQTLDVQLDDRN